MSTIDLTIHAEIRTDMGKGASRRLRRSDKLPAILYGAGQEPVALTLDHNKVNNMADHEVFYSQIINLVIDGESHEAILKDVQRHPFKPKLTHIDFQRVKRGEKLHTNVPVHFINEETAHGVKQEGGVIAHHIAQVEIKCRPRHLPEYIEVDVANLKLGETMHLSDLTLPEGVELVELSKGADHDQAVVSINAPRVEAAAEEETAEEPSAEVPTAKESEAEDKDAE
ncbi:50S ribosomal protein L25/general stress protein Ctc [Pseudidiomarina taiwanensis]|uniref:Large ribosomal subunit protein bL25 n=1 Tax=Pseudidiomarina taiwanensis TaxID=337250 RepID=A0A432ZP11_9GAMM|nr:50S ribosomal protein L25/general stress protein Ctc [Pseudidiomarina taiwanensis]RUO79623.1 50S ribosomal protein L25 [Pseudidiomarina taiwanensis]